MNRQGVIWGLANASYNHLVHGDPLLRPGEIRAVTPECRSGGGYDEAEVDQLLTNIADSYQVVWDECDRLERALEKREKQLQEARDREHAIADSLVTAQSAAADIRREAEQHAERVVADARQRADDLLAEAQARKRTLTAEIERLRQDAKDLHDNYQVFLLSALEILNNKGPFVPEAADPMPGDPGANGSFAPGSVPGPDQGRGDRDRVISVRRSLGGGRRA
jgi:cell division initiation protein